ncbi:MAG: hypothetical protein GWP08_10355 [Nitrospiraceae bacterium]|nr:hypothetical protein [Nitrospiraceae bacterium]
MDIKGLFPPGLSKTVREKGAALGTFLKKRPLVAILLIVAAPVVIFAGMLWMQSRDSEGAQSGDAKFSFRSPSTQRRKPLVGKTAGAASKASRDSKPSKAGAKALAELAQTEQVDGEAVAVPGEAVEVVQPTTVAARVMAAAAAAPPDNLSPETYQALQSALNSLDVKVGITKLERLLKTLENIEEASKIYCALGALYAESEPPESTKAEHAYRTANDLAGRAEDRYEATFLLAGLLRTKEDYDGALTEIAIALGYSDVLTPRRLRLTVLQGRLYEDTRVDEAAETAYDRAMEESLAASALYGDKALAVYRQACLALAQLYRRTGRDAEARAVARTMKTKLERYKRRELNTP